ncbi:hypothetical protein GCM10009780_64500 [Actinomadura alba]
MGVEGPDLRSDVTASTRSCPLFTLANCTLIARSLGADLVFGRLVQATSLPQPGHPSRLVAEIVPLGGPTPWLPKLSPP